MKKLLLCLFFICCNVSATQVYILDIYFDGQDLLNTPVAKNSEEQLHGTKVLTIIKDINPTADYELRSTPSLARMIKSIRMIGGNKRTVVNISLWLDSDYGNSCNRLLQHEINRAVDRGVIFIVSAGNDGKNVIEHSPANCKDVITVGAHRDGKIRPYSNFGNDVYIYAPEGNYKGRVITGTSFAAPIVTGLVSKWLDEDNTLSLDEIKLKLKSISDENKVLVFH